MRQRLEGRSAVRVTLPCTAAGFEAELWPGWQREGLRIPAAHGIVAPGGIEVSVWMADARVLLPATLEGDDREGLARFSSLAEALVEDLVRAPEHALLPAGDPLVVLDPCVSIAPDRKPTMHLLLHAALDTIMVVPEGDGLLDLVECLREPTSVAKVAEAFDDAPLVQQVIGTLAQHGFVHALDDASAGAPDFSRRRHRSAPYLAGRQRARLELPLGALDGAGGLLERVREDAWPPVVVLHAAELGAFHRTLDELAAARRDGSLRLHDIIVSTADEAISPALAASLFGLGARVYFGRGERWSEPTASEVALVAAGVSTTRRVRVRAAELAEPDGLEPLAMRAREDRLAGLSLELALDEPATSAELIEPFLREVARLDESLGDAELANLASDEEALGNEAARAGTLAERGAAPETFASRLRDAHLRALGQKLRKRENRVLWAQVPQAEDLWVKSREDLLPNNPELLGLRPGATVVDFCGGMGRVARRMEPNVGPSGTIISIENEDLIVERARRFAAEAGRGNIQFRKGLAQRVALPDAFADAAINEWTGVIWQLGLGPAMLSEMARVVKPGGRVAVTHRLVILRLDDLLRPTSAIANIYRQVMDAFAAANLEILEERVWGQKLPQFKGAPLAWLVEEYLPRIYPLLDGRYEKLASDRADTYLTVIGRRPDSG